MKEKIERITVKYDRKTFWNLTELAMDSNACPSRKDALKAFRALKKCYSTALDIVYKEKTFCIFYDNLKDFEAQILTVREYDFPGWNSYSDTKKSFEVVKKQMIPARDEE